MAVVGLPCQVHGLKNVIHRFPALSRKIGIVTGVFCDRIMTYAAIDYLLKVPGYSDSDKATFHFRDKKWEGTPEKFIHDSRGNP